MSPADPHFQAKAPAAAHLSATLLRQYAAGTLSAAERRQVERHTLACPLCADALEGFQQAAPAAVTPAALAALQQRLHARVAQEPATATREGGAWWWAAAAAVALLLTFVGIWQWPRPETPPVAARQEVSAPAASAPAAAAAPETAAAPAAVATRPAEPTVAAAPASGVRRRRPAARPAVAARRAASDDVAAVQLEDAVTMNGIDEGSASRNAEVATALPPEAAPVEAKQELKEEVAPATGNLAATSARMAAKKAAPPAPAASEAAAPASAAPASPEESVKRKADLPAAPDLAPYPAGGYLAFRSYLQHEQQRPNMGIGGPTHSSGTVKLKFTVEADGAVRNIQVVRGVNPDYDEEAIRLICEGPAWRPAIVNGRRAAQSVRLDVPFH